MIVHRVQLRRVNIVMRNRRVVGEPEFEANGLDERKAVRRNNCARSGCHSQRKEQDRPQSRPQRRGAELVAVRNQTGKKGGGTRVSD